MSHKLNALMAAAIALVAAPAAHATLGLPNATSGGNSSVAFVAMDANGSISYAADLGVRMADFLPLIAGQTFAQGGLSQAGTTATFNLFNNSYSLNGVAQAGTNAWSGNLNNFLNNANVAGGNYSWGIVAGDSTIPAPSSTEAARSLNLLFSSGTFVDYNNATEGIVPNSISGATTRITEFFAGSNAQAGGTHAAGVNGSNTATSGDAFLGQGMVLNGQGNFGVDFGMNNYLVAPGDTSYFSWASINGSNASTATFGNMLGVGQDPAAPSTWTWNAVTGDLTYTVPVPEASTYAMLVTGLAAMSLVVRRRRKS